MLFIENEVERDSCVFSSVQKKSEIAKDKAEDRVQSTSIESEKCDWQISNVSGAPRLKCTSLLQIDASARILEFDDHIPRYLTVDFGL